ncbi:MAG: DUF502 domain-containing protein [Planctomycetota bacterium]|nr:MAG: DUF502 domain-containing protein [Planctomycetota bacterium]
MFQAFVSFWRRRVVGTFLTGVVVLLPLAATFAVMGWVGIQIRNAVGPDTLLGDFLRRVGLQFVTDPFVAIGVGWVLVLIGVWFFGLVVQWTAQARWEAAIDNVMRRIPVIRSVYGPIAQVVSMVARADAGEMHSMQVVYLEFGDAEAAGMLGLLASPRRFRFRQRDCYIVYIPTSPLPMSGGIVFVPVEHCHRVEMSVEELMQIYFSLGVMADHAVPPKYGGRQAGTPGEPAAGTVSRGEAS